MGMSCDARRSFSAILSTGVLSPHGFPMGSDVNNEPRGESPWTHALCGFCWDFLCAEVGQIGREPVRVVECRRVACCRCGEPTESGIFIRRAPDAFPCHGRTGYHEEPKPKRGEA